MGIAIFCTLSCTNLRADDASWIATASGSWSTGTNWDIGTAPGATSSTANMDSATFSTLPSGPELITIDQPNQNIGSIVDGMPGKITIGTMTGNALLLSSGGSISVLSNTTSTASAAIINAPLVLEAASPTSNGTYTFLNNDNFTNDFLQFGGDIGGGTTTGSITLDLAGVGGTRSSIISGAISNGTATRGVGVAVESGSWTLSGVNSYTGNTTLNGGSLVLTGSLNSGSKLVANGGTFTDTSSNSLQTVNGLVVNRGLTTINVTAGKTLNLGTVTRNAGALVDFAPALVGTTGTPINTTNSGFLGPWAIYSTGITTSYAMGGGGSGPLSRYSGGTTATAGTMVNMTDSTVNFTYATGSPSNVTLVNDSIGNTLEVDGLALVTNAGNSLTLNGLLTGQSGVFTFSGGGGSMIIGASHELDIINGGKGSIQISTGITGTGTVVFGSLGGAGVVLSGNSTYTGDTILTSGSFTYTGGSLGSGKLIIDNGAIISGNYSAISNAQIWNGNFSYGSSGGSVIGAGSITINADNVAVTNASIDVVTENEDIGGTGNLTLVGAFRLLGAVTNRGDLTLNGSISVLGHTVSNMGDLTLNGDVSLAQGANNAGTITNVSTGNGTIALGNIGSNVTGVIQNSARTMLVLTGTNSYTGGTTVLSGTLQVTGLGNLGSGGVRDNGTLLLSQTGSVTISDVISGTGIVQQSGFNTLVLSAANTFSGGVNMTNGTIQLSGAGTLGATTGTLSMSGSSLLDLNGTNQTIGFLSGSASTTILNGAAGTASVFTIGTGTGSGNYAGIIEDNSGQGGTVALVKVGSGNQVLSGNNHYTGGTTVLGGTLTVSSNMGLGTGNVLNSATLALVDTASVIQNNISGSGAVSVSGTSSLTLTGSNSFTGGITVLTGTLSLGSLGVLGTTGTITIAPSGVLQFNAANTTDYSSRFNTTAGQTYNIDTNGQSVTFAANINSAGGALFKGGMGTLTLLGTNTFTGNGGTTVYGGTLVLGANAVLNGAGGALNINNSVVDLGGSTQSVGPVQLNGGTLQNGTINSEDSITALNGTNTVSANFGGAGSIVVDTTLIFTGNGTYTGSTGFNTGGVLQVGNGGTTGSLGTGKITLFSSKLIFDRSDNLTQSNAIGGGGSLIQEGAGILTLNGSSTYTGGTHIMSGAINVPIATALGTSSVTVDAGGALQVQGGIILVNPTLITLTGTGLSSNGALENVSGINTVTTPIVISGSASIGSDAGTLVLNSLTPISGSGSVTFTGSGNGTVTSNINLGAGSVIKNGSGTWTLAGNSNYTGTTTISNGTLKIATLASVGTAQPLGKSGTLVFTGASSSAPGVLQYTGATATMAQNVTVSTGDYGVIDNTGGGVLTLSGTLTKDGSVLTLAGGSFVVSGHLVGPTANSDLMIGSSTYAGPAIVGLTGTNSYNGATVISGGGTLLTGASGALPVATPTALTLGAATDTVGQINTLDLLGTSQTVSSLTGTGAAINQIVSSNGSATTPAIGSFASSAPGSLIVNYNGTTPDTFSGSLGGSGALTRFSLTKTGTGTLILTGTNTYTGFTTVSAGTLQIGNGGATGTISSGNIIDNASLVYDLSANVTVANNISGSGTISSIGSGVLTLTGTNSLSGSMNIGAGTLSVASASSLGSGPITFGGGGGLLYTGGSATLSQNITVTSGNGTINNAGGGVLTLSGSLNKNGTVLHFSGGSFVVTGAIVGSAANSDVSYDAHSTVGLMSNSTFNGPTTISGSSTLLTGVNNALPTPAPYTALTMGGVGDAGTDVNTLDLLGTTQTVASLGSAGVGVNQIVSSNGSATTPAIGSRASSSTGNLIIATSSGTATTYAGLLGDSNTGAPGRNGNNFSVTVTGTGTQSFTHATGNTYTGGTTISSGTLLVSNTSGSALGTGPLLVTGTLSAIGTAGASGTVTSTNNTITSGSVLTGGTGTADVTSVLTMTGTGTTAFTNANLVFNLSTTSLGQGSELALGATPSVLFSATTLTLNLQGANIVPNSTEYALLTSTTIGTGIGGSIFTGDLGYDSGTHIITGLDIVFNNVPGAGYYANSYLKLIATGNGGYDIDVVVVPEPGTWGLLLGGLALLGLHQFRRRSRSCAS